MATVTVKSTTHGGTHVWTDVQWIGSVLVYRMSPDFDHGLYANRPWHIVTFGHNFPTLDDCLNYLRAIKRPTYDGSGRYRQSSECEAAYLRCE